MLAANIRDNYKACFSGRPLGSTLGKALKTVYRKATGIEKWVGQDAIATWLEKHYHMSYDEATDYYWGVMYPQFDACVGRVEEKGYDLWVCILALWAFTEEVDETNPTSKGEHQC